MAFGLAGAHRSGKTTLAKAISETMGIPYVSSSLTAEFKDLGIDPVAPMSLRKRLEVQKMYLGLYASKVLGPGLRPFVTDRTPLDIAAYMLAETSMFADPSVDPDEIADFVSICLQMAVSQFASILVVPPLILYDAAEGKPPENRAYQLQIDALVSGLAMRCVSKCGHIVGMDAAVTDHDRRLQYAVGMVQERLASLEKQRAGTSLH